MGKCYIFAEKAKCYPFMCDGISINPRKGIATVIGGEFDGVQIFQIHGACDESCLPDLAESYRRKPHITNDWYAEKNGNKFSLPILEEGVIGKRKKYRQLSLFECCD